MNKQFKSADNKANKLHKDVFDSTNTYIQKLINTTHKDLETALEQKLNLAFNKRKTPAAKKIFDVREYEGNRSPNYLRSREKSREKKVKQKPVNVISKPLLKDKSKEPTNNIVSRAKPLSKDGLKESLQFTEGNKFKEPPHDVPKKHKAKGLNAVPDKEQSAETSPIDPNKKAIEQVNMIEKEKLKEVLALTNSNMKRGIKGKGDKKIFDKTGSQKKGITKINVTKSQAKK